jgi:uncharacterized protein (DUF1697 family)
MPRFVVLLRGVNVGKGNRVPMADLKALLEGLGYTSVGTLLNSGNAVFTSTSTAHPKHAAAIAAELQKKLNVTTPVIIKSAVDLAEIIKSCPITPPATDHSKFLVAFAAEESELHALKPLQDLAQAPERFEVTEVAAFLHCPAGVLQSRVGKALLGNAGKRVTLRNWATVIKLHCQAVSGVA